MTSFVPRAAEVTELVQTWRTHRENIHAGHIIPIGEEPEKRTSKTANSMCLWNNPAASFS